MNRLAARFAVLFAAALAAAMPAAASEPPDPGADTRRAARLLGDAAEKLRTAPSAGNRLAALSGAVRAHERALGVLRETGRRLAARQAALTADIDARRSSLSALLGLLVRIETAPSPARLVHPGGPLAAARAGHLLAGMAPVLDAELIDLQAALAEIALVAAETERVRTLVRDGFAGLVRARAALAEALTRDRPLPQADRTLVEVLRRDAATLAALASALGDDATPAPSGDGDFAARQGTLALPVEGEIVRGFAEPDAAGLERPGITVSAEPFAVVTSPVRATLRWAGPFLDYGGMAILEPQAGYLLVLAGLGRIDRVPGEVIGAGDPVGAMGGPLPASEEFLIVATDATRAIPRERLYVELRKDGNPVDPAPWFAPGTPKEGQE